MCEQCEPTSSSHNHKPTLRLGDSDQFGCEAYLDALIAQIRAEQQVLGYTNGQIETEKGIMYGSVCYPRWRIKSPKGWPRIKQRFGLQDWQYVFDSRNRDLIVGNSLSG